MKEIENWEVHKTFQKLANEGQSTISVRHVVRKKNKTKENIYKARVVARCFEDIEKENTRKYPPSCCKENFRIIHSLDIQSAFLHGQSINRNVFLSP